jgi:arginyl-tRNA synthetase
MAIGTAFGPEAMTDPLLKAGDPKFADYQANVAMALAKKLNLKPREVAEQIVRHLDRRDAASGLDICDPPVIAGPGFINLRLRADWLARTLSAAFAGPTGPRAGVDKQTQEVTVVVDYSGPNIAKQMHVGHLRSTVIGDTLARVLAFLGQRVIRQNHLGDYGTQFGLLISYLRRQGLTQGPLSLDDLGTYYKQASALFKTDPAFAIEARDAVVELQQGQPQAVELWLRMKAEGRKHYTAVYKMLSITLAEADERGESFYGPRLAGLVERVKASFEFGGEGAAASAHSGIQAPPWQVSTGDMSDVDAAEARGGLDTADAMSRAKEAGEPVTITKPFAAVSDGALCVFLPGYVTREKMPLPLMIQKTNGGFGYAATDLAALYFRVREVKTTAADQAPLHENWHADRVIIATDARQTQHLAMVFDAARAAKWDVNPETGLPAALDHAAFGSILGEDNKPFKTRSGDSIGLLDLLKEAIDRARAVVVSKNPDLPAATQESVARAVGIAAIKYADLRQDRILDYVFAWDRMLSLEGNTGPYLQYAYTRVAGIFRKAQLDRSGLAAITLTLADPRELALARKLVQFGFVVESVGRDLKPHYLCNYLFDLAGLFSGFYENCPVLKAPDEATRLSRLRLCDMVARTLEVGLRDLLGIEVLEEM